MLDIIEVDYLALKTQLERAAMSDPFTHLGPIDDAEMSLRIWDPNALSVSIEVNNKQYPLTLLEPGLFGLNDGKAIIKGSLYLVHAVLADKRTVSYFDPYQFRDIAPNKTRVHEPIHAFREMGAQLCQYKIKNQSVAGTRFVVFAPNASAVSVIGDFNHWNGQCHPMQRLEEGLWALFIPELAEGASYKFELKDGYGNRLPHKADPWGYNSDQYPSFASRVYDHAAYKWRDKAWQTRPFTEPHKAPLSFYELHAGSWKRKENGDYLTYRELAAELIPYLQEMGYTHLELMPISEYPFYGSWGYQPIGLFAPTSRFGTPDDFKYFVDACHQANIGVILDWVPAHFPADEHGLANFDGSALFNDPDPRRGWHQDWQSFIYDYSRPHVREFLVSNALYWFEHFHLDGLRVDAVASMLYLDYSRNHGEWIPNHEGGNHNHDAISLLRWFNEEIYKHFPNAITIAEESTAFDGVTRPTYAGGLGFGFKWNMGWMHDSLSYIKHPPVHRKYHHHELTFPMIYAFSENYVLSLSHDEVVYGKGAIHDKMPGDEWQKAANLRAYLGYMYGQPGKKLNFMGTEIGQTAEWNFEGQLEWHWLQYDKHQGIQRLVKDLNKLYRDFPALYQSDCNPSGFEWRILDDGDNSVIAHERLGDKGERMMIISNFTPVTREHYRIPTPMTGTYRLCLNTDESKYWGAATATCESVDVVDGAISLTLPPLSTLFLEWVK